MMVFGTVKVFLLTMLMQNGIVVSMVQFQDETGQSQFLEYRIEGCGDLGNQYVSRDGFTTQWQRNGFRVVDQIATRVCAKIEAAQQFM